MKLREYQSNAIERVRDAIRGGAKRILLVAPTGSGKTVIGAELVRLAHQKQKHSLWMAHRRELIEQAHEKITTFGADAGMILSGKMPSLMSPVQVASIQTFASRVWQSSKVLKPMAQVLVLDEAHHATAKTYTRLVDDYPDAITIGLTATPCRTDGRGLGHLFDTMIEVSTVKELTELGYLVPLDVFAPTLPDLHGVKVRGGDYVTSELGERMMPMVGNVVDSWLKIARHHQTVVYASSVKHSIALAQEFEMAGIPCAHLDGETHIRDREEILERHRTGELQVVCNFGVLTEGWDQPSCSCAVIARPTKSYGLYLQMAGRVLRPYDQKPRALVIDHGGLIYEHGHPEDAGGWMLDKEYRITERPMSEKEKREILMTCRNCWMTYTGSRRCPHCGCTPSREGEEVSMREGRLKKTRKPPKKPEDRYWHDCLWRCVRTNRSVVAAAHIFKKRFGAWPRNVERAPGNDEEWEMSAREFMNVCRSREINNA